MILGQYTRARREEAFQYLKRLAPPRPQVPKSEP